MAPRKPHQIAEMHIHRAQARGELDDLEGAGKPLPDRPEHAVIDPGLAIGHRIMAEAGALPEEIRLRKALEAAWKDLAAIPDGPARKAKLAEIAELDMKLAIESEARRKFLR